MKFNLYVVKKQLQNQGKAQQNKKMGNGQLIITSLDCKNENQTKYTRGIVNKQYKLKLPTLPDFLKKLR